MVSWVSLLGFVFLIFQLYQFYHSSDFLSCIFS